MITKFHYVWISRKNCSKKFIIYSESSVWKYHSFMSLKIGFSAGVWNENCSCIRFYINSNCFRRGGWFIYLISNPIFCSKYYNFPLTWFKKWVLSNVIWMRNSKNLSFNCWNQVLYCSFLNIFVVKYWTSSVNI